MVLFNLAEDLREYHDYARDPTQADRLAALHASLVTEFGEQPDDIDARLRRDRAEPDEAKASPSPKGQSTAWLHWMENHGLSFQS